ncbi:hypothetical protein GCM10023201_33480 [Actinomycetospora corticicola]|uniref:O-antigen ligase-like membrane protein n=1 Tax=Actinomycetospora corticicola TaxID=663602 RepID=A0A7Y9DS77_9PSEU|nr:hypothetical protein [Actinomycetospora corticicola]NYD34528.1 hypothetical protein [Actinomycetospora corticicola]
MIGLFLLDVLLQRLAVPGLPIALLLPVTLGWAVLAHRRRVVEIDATRLIWWALACGATGLMLLLQPLVVAGPLISIPSWALVVVTSLPFALRVRDRSVATYTRMLRGAETIGCWLAVGCLAMTGTQLLGVPYRDVLADVLPSTLLLTDFNNTYPYSYGSTLFRANAWIGLEPSFTSFQLGIALLASVLLRRSIWRTVLLVAGIASTAAGSGILLVAVGVFVLALYRRRMVLRRYVAPVVVLVGAVLATSFGQSLLGRSTEFSDPNSSTSLRAILPYDVLWPRWVAQTGVMLVGDGPGSSQVLATSTGIGGLLVPTPVKIFFDYGLLGGAVLAAFLLACYVRSPSVSIAVALLLSLWTVQPGLTTTALLLNAVIFVSLWVPRVEPPLEARPPTPRDEAPAEQGA